MKNESYVAQPWYGNANFITAVRAPGAALPRPLPVKGGVLTRFYLGTIVPAYTDRQTFLGDCLWSERACPSRAIATQELFDGAMPLAQARGPSWR